MIQAIQALNNTEWSSKRFVIWGIFNEKTMFHQKFGQWIHKLSNGLTVIGFWKKSKKYICVTNTTQNFLLQINKMKVNVMNAFFVNFIMLHVSLLRDKFLPIYDLCGHNRPKVSNYWINTDVNMKLKKY